MKLPHKGIISLIALVTLPMGAAVAQEAAAVAKEALVEPDPDELLTQYDQNNDQALSMQEFESLYKEQIEVKSQKEEDTNSAQPSHALFSNLDVDEDSQLSAGELGQVTSLIAGSDTSN